MNELNKYQENIGQNKDINKMKLHYDYDYQSYNYTHNNHASNSLTLLSSNEEYNNNLLIQSKSNNNLIQNINRQKYLNENSRSSTNLINNKMNNPLTEIPKKNNKIYKINYSSKPNEHLKNIADTVNINENKIYVYNEEIKKNKNNYSYNNIENIDDNNQYEYEAQIKNKTKNRNMSLKINENTKYSSNAFKVNQIVQDFEKALKEKEEAENKLLYIISLNNSKKNIFEKNYGYNREERNTYLKENNKVNKEKSKDNTNFYNTFNKLSECSVGNNNENDIFKIEEEKKLMQKTANNFIENKKPKAKNKNGLDKKSNSTTKLQAHKSTPQLNAYVNEEISNFTQNKNININLNNYKNIKDLEMIRDKLFIANNKLEEQKKEFTSKYKIIKTKYELLSKENLMIKTKYDINKNNLMSLQKKIEEKNYEIEQMKKILISNNKQINYLNTIKESNTKTTHENEELIQQLKDTIFNLNETIKDNNEKINYLEKENKINQMNKIQKYKKENDSLKNCLNERETMILNLKNAIIFMNKNLDDIMNNNNNMNETNNSEDIDTNKENENIINECQLRIEQLRNKIEKMNERISEISNENKNKENEKNEFKIKINELIEKFEKIKNENEILNKSYEEQNSDIEKYKNKILESDELISEMNKKNEELMKEIEDKNSEITEMKKDIEEKEAQIENINIEIEKKNKEINEKNIEIEKKGIEIEEKNKMIEENKNELEKRKDEIEEKNKIIENNINELNEKNKEIEAKNKEINDRNKIISEKQSQIENKDKELEEKKKEIDLQVITKANLEFFEKVKQLEIEIKNKDKQIEELKTKKVNDEYNNNINNISFKDIKQSPAFNLKNKISYTEMNKISPNNNNKNINTDFNNIHDLTKKILFYNNYNEPKKEIQNDYQIEKSKDNNYDNYPDKNKMKININYNDYNKNEFKNKKMNNKIKRDNLNKICHKENKNKKPKVNINRSKISNNSNNSHITNISSYEKNSKSIRFNDDIENYENFEHSQNLGKSHYNFNYNKNIKYKNTQKLSQTPDININKEFKVPISSTINYTEQSNYEDFENKNNLSYRDMELDSLNDNNDDINKYNNYYTIKKNNNNKNNNYYDNDNDINTKSNKDYNKYLNKRKNKNNKEPNVYNNSKNNNAILITSSSISVTQNDCIYNMKITETALQNYSYIYSILGSDLICFNLREKKFELIPIKDNTNGLLNSYISYYKQNKLNPLLLNTKKGFYILMNKQIFYFDQLTYTITILTKLLSYHTNGSFIYIKDDLYIISGNNITKCEKYSLVSKQNIILPDTNYPRINSGVCNVNNKYIYLFFGQFCDNSIERLYLKNNNYNSNEKWEIIKINKFNGFNDDIIYLDKFVTFLDYYNNIIIFGGQNYCNGKPNKNIIGFNLDNRNLSIIGKIDSCALYTTQYISLDESIFSIYDINNGLHFFNKELDYHEIFNLNI